MPVRRVNGLGQVETVKVSRDPASVPVPTSWGSADYPGAQSVMWAPLAGVLPGEQYPLQHPSTIRIADMGLMSGWSVPQGGVLGQLQRGGLAASEAATQSGLGAAATVLPAGTSCVLSGGGVGTQDGNGNCVAALAAGAVCTQSNGQPGLADGSGNCNPAVPDGTICNDPQGNPSQFVGGVCVSDGSTCTDGNGNVGQYLGGVCQATPAGQPADGTPCTDGNGNPGQYLGGSCFASDTAAGSAPASSVASSTTASAGTAATASGLSPELQFILDLIMIRRGITPPGMGGVGPAATAPAPVSRVGRYAAEVYARCCRGDL